MLELCVLNAYGLARFVDRSVIDQYYLSHPSVSPWTMIEYTYGQAILVSYQNQKLPLLIIPPATLGATSDYESLQNRHVSLVYHTKNIHRPWKYVDYLPYSQVNLSHCYVQNNLRLLNSREYLYFPFASNIQPPYPLLLVVTQDYKIPCLFHFTNVWPCS